MEDVKGTRRRVNLVGIGEFGKCAQALCDSAGVGADWNDFKYFLAIEKAGSLAGAARALSCEHSTVSRRLNQLEEALGAKLFF